MVEKDPVLKELNGGRRRRRKSTKRRRRKSTKRRRTTKRRKSTRKKRRTRSIHDIVDMKKLKKMRGRNTKKLSTKEKDMLGKY